MFTSFKSVSLLLLAGTILSLPIKAHAVVATSADVHGSEQNVIMNTNKQEQATRDQITEAAKSIVEAIGESSSKETSDNTAMMKYQANTNNAKDQRATEMAIAGEKLKAENSVTSGASMCNKLTGAATTGELEILTNLWRKGQVNNLHSYDAGYIDGHGTTLYPQTASVSAFNSSHCANNSTQDDVTNKTCDRVTQKDTTNSARMIDGKKVITTPDDQNANIMIGQDTMSPTEQESVGRLLVLLSNPHTTSSETIDDNMDPETRKQLVYEQSVHRARKSVAQSIISGIAAQSSSIDTKAGGQNSIKSMASGWAEKTAPSVVGYIKKDDPLCANSGSGGSSCYFPNGVSELEADELTSKSWYYNINWGVFASSQSESPTLKDLVMMQAWNTMMQFKEYKELREMNLSLAAILAIIVDEQQSQQTSK